MMCAKFWSATLIFLLYFNPAYPAIAHSGEISLALGAGRINRKVQSFHEIRQAYTVRQKWDRSCGSAALSTILTHHYGDSTSEALIIMSILKITDPSKIRARGGFSLLDLKRFLETRGYEGKGYSGMALEELAGMEVPAIVPVRVRGYDHFVVFRGIRGSRVSLSDPAFGILTLKISDFLEIWKGGVGFIALREGFKSPKDGPFAKGEDFLVPDGSSVIRVGLKASSNPLIRRALRCPHEEKYFLPCLAPGRCVPVFVHPSRSYRCRGGNASERFDRNT